MKIIYQPAKGGVLQECYHCFSVLEVDRKDLMKSEFHFSQWMYECPVCKNKVVFMERYTK